MTCSMIGGRPTCIGGSALLQIPPAGKNCDSPLSDYVDKIRPQAELDKIIKEVEDEVCGLITTVEILLSALCRV